jgi:formylglycine-generating enzyme
MEIPKVLDNTCCAPSSSRPHDGAVASQIRPASGELAGKMIAGMIALPDGTFLMGTEDPEGFAQNGEVPIHSVTLDPFLIDIHPVTNELFEQFNQNEFRSANWPPGA